MPATFYDSAMIEYQNLLCVHNRREPMRDYDGCPMKHQALERFLNQPLGRGVHARRRFVEDQDWRILQERTRNREALFFADAQFYAAFAYHAFQTGGNLSMKPRALAASTARHNSASVACG